MRGTLILKDNTEFEGESFGARRAVAGEVVFATGMVGYPESLTDPSYAGQILVLTYPLIGNYGVPERRFWESGKIQVSGLVVSNYVDTPSHYQSRMTLSQWLRKENVPALEIKDTRMLTQKFRHQGVMLGKMVFGSDVSFQDPNERNLVAEVSTKRILREGRGGRKIVLFDCGTKRNITRRLLARKVQVTTLPWDYDMFRKNLKADAIVVSNGPGDPTMAGKTVAIIREALHRRVPILGICLGNQILALAAGGKTAKLKFGHRGQNQPCRMTGSRRSFLTTQNHGYAVSRIPRGFKAWFTNANDGTNEGLIHKTLPVMSVQFHPEAHPGPTDTDWVFDDFLKRARLL